MNTVSKTVSLLLVVCFFLCGCSEREDTLKIGFMIDERVAYNQDAIAAARMLVDEVNTGGGIKVGDTNYQLALLVRDCGAAGNNALQEARKLVLSEDVRFIIGPNSTRAAMQVAPFARQTKFLMLTPGATHPSITRDNPYVFRSVNSDAYTAQAMVAFSLQLAEKQRTAILYDESDPYTRFLSEQISRNIHEVSGYKPLMLSYHGSQKDYRALLLQAKTNGVRLIIAPGYTDDVILQLTQAHSLAMDNLWLGSDAWDLEKIALIDDFDGAYVFQLAVPNIENTDDKLKYFAERFYQRYRRPITLGSMVSADSIAILLQAIKDVDSTSPELVSQYMRRGFVFDGFVGHYQFDENGDPNLQARFFRIKNHEIIEVEAKLR